MTRRGRPRKHKWFHVQALENASSRGGQYLIWASANNTALQTVAATGCPRCHSPDFEFRHDSKYKVIRFHCIRCRHETSYRIKTPKPGSFQVVPVLHDGVRIGDKIVDSYHPVTRRQRSDAVILRATRSVEEGRISLGGEWFVDNVAGGTHDQKRYYVNFGEAVLICSWNRMQAEHEKRLRELEQESMI